MKQVRAKKHLGQHFLNDLSIAKDICDAMPTADCATILEIGPGMGVLTQFLNKSVNNKLKVIEIDRDSVAYLQENFILQPHQIIEGDFLKLPLDQLPAGQIGLIGNFPYNISSQILFTMLDNKERFPALVGMFQKEVAERVASIHGNKDYGILSVVLQTYYDCEYLFTVHENVFTPPPKVKSGVIRLVRRTEYPSFDYKKFKTFVKLAFNQRRKTLRNAIKPMLPAVISDELEVFLTKRAEQLSVAEFHTFYRLIAAA